MRETATKKIDGQAYTFTELGPREAYRVYVWLLGVLGDNLAAVAKVLQKLLRGGAENLKDVKLQDVLNSKDMDFEAIGGAFGSIMASLSDAKSEAFVDTLLGSVLKDGEALNLDSIAFQGRMKHLTRVVYEAARYNFADFFERGAGPGAGSQGKTNSQATGSGSRT